MWLNSIFFKDKQFTSWQFHNYLFPFKVSYFSLYVTSLQLMYVPLSMPNIKLTEMITYNWEFILPGDFLVLESICKMPKKMT